MDAPVVQVRDGEGSQVFIHLAKNFPSLEELGGDVREKHNSSVIQENRSLHSRSLHDSGLVCVV